MASKSRRIANVNGAAIGPLRSVAVVDTSKGLAANAVKNAARDQQATTKDILAAIKQFVADSDQYQLALDAKQSDEILGRIASLLDEVKDSFVQNELEDMKQEILDEISGMSLSSVLKSFFLNQIANLFDDDAKKDDIEELKSWIQENFSTASNSGSDGESAEPEAPVEAEELAEDVEKGDYKDSTPAENFYVLQEFIQGQLDILNENLKNIPGQSGMFSKLGKSISAGFFSVLGKVSSIGKIAMKGAAALGKGIKGVMSGIGGLGAKVGGFIASPFKKISGVMSKLNPFKRTEKKKEDKKQKLKDKIMDKISKVIEKMWKVLEPVIDKLVEFMAIMHIMVILPMTFLVAKVVFITAAIIAAGVIIFLVIKKIIDSVKKFIKYVKSGQLWKDIKAKLLQAWQGTKNMGKWIWDQLVKLGNWIWDKICGLSKTIFIEFPLWIWEKLCEFGTWLWDKLIEFGQWLYDNFIGKYVVEPLKNMIRPLLDIWEKLCEFGTWLWDKLIEFGQWLYDNFIGKYVVEPLKNMIRPLLDIWEKKIKPAVQPFIDSLTNLKDRIVKAFSAWDSNKSIWENLKNISGIIKDSVIEWWKDSPFNRFYQQYLEPFVRSAKDLFSRLANLGGFIKNAILDWWNGDSSLGDTLTNIGTTIMNTVKEWYETSPLKPIIDEIIRALKLYVIAPINGIKRKIASFIVKLADDFVIKIPTFNFTDSWKPWNWSVEWCEFHPFAFATKNWTPEQKQAAVNDGEKSTMDLIKEEMVAMQKKLAAAEKPKTNIDLEAPNKQQQRDLAAQQVQQAAEPLYQLDVMTAQDRAEAVKASQEMSAEVAEKENYQKLYYAKQDDKSNAILEKLNAMDGNINKKLDDPAVIPMYLPSYNNHLNSAMMERN